MIESLSIACPAYNEGAKIEAILEEWISYFRKLEFKKGFEIVVCDDGSKDNTAEIVQDLSKRHPEIRLVRHSANQGAAAALWNAIAHTTKQWVLLQDSDGQFPISNFELLAVCLEAHPNALATSGVRKRKNDSLLNRSGSWMSGKICNWVHGTNFKDFNCALKLVNGEVLRNLLLESKGMNYSLELTSKLIEQGISQIEVEVEVDDSPPPKRSLNSNLRRVRDRFLFVSYLALRQSLIRAKVLSPQEIESGGSERGKNESESPKYARL